MWTTIDEEGREYLTKVHQVECRDQIFSNKAKQFICRKSGGDLCLESCPFYSNLGSYLREYEEIPVRGIDIGNTNIKYGDNNYEEVRSKLEDESIDFTDDDKLLDYLRTQVWD